MARFVPNKASMNRTFRSRGGLVGRYIEGKGQTLTALARGQVGVRTGFLRSRIRYTMFNRSNSVGDISVRVGATHRIARIHHDGTKAHIIKPRYKKALRFQQHGKIVFAKIVKHPGTKPNRFLTDNLPKVIN